MDIVPNDVNWTAFAQVWFGGGHMMYF